MPPPVFVAPKPAFIYTRPPPPAPAFASISTFPPLSLAVAVPALSTIEPLSNLLNPTDN